MPKRSGSSARGGRAAATARRTARRINYSDIPEASSEQLKERPDRIKPVARTMAYSRDLSMSVEPYTVAVIEIAAK